MNLSFYVGDSGFCPTESFIYSRYGERLDKPLAEKELADIGRAWQYVLEIKGVPGGNFIEKYRDYDAFCIRIKHSRTLIRFPFFRDLTNDRIVLLDGFAKTDGYKPNDKTGREIKRKMNDSQTYYNDYNADNNRQVISKVIKSISCNINDL